MGYWHTSKEGASFAQHFPDDDSEKLLWGDAPADAIDDGMRSLIARLTRQLGRYPTVDEIDWQKFILPSDEMTLAIRLAKVRFYKDIGRLPSDDEVMAGLRFSDTETCLMFYKQSDRSGSAMDRARKSGRYRIVQNEEHRKILDDIEKFYDEGDE